MAVGYANNDVGCKFVLVLLMDFLPYFGLFKQHWDIPKEYPGLHLILFAQYVLALNLCTCGKYNIMDTVTPLKIKSFYVGSANHRLSMAKVLVCSGTFR